MTLTTVPSTVALTGYFVGDIFPGTGRLLLQPKGNFFFFVIDVQNDHFEFFVDLHHLRGMVDPSPAHVGNVQQAVDSTQIDKRAKIGNVLDHALARLADFEFLQQLGFFLGPLGFDRDCGG